MQWVHAQLPALVPVHHVMQPNSLLGLQGLSISMRCVSTAPLMRVHGLEIWIERRGGLQRIFVQVRRPSPGMHQAPCTDTLGWTSTHHQFHAAAGAGQVHGTPTHICRHETYDGHEQRRIILPLP